MLRNCARNPFFLSARQDDRGQEDDQEDGQGEGARDGLRPRGGTPLLLLRRVGPLCEDLHAEGVAFRGIPFSLNQILIHSTRRGHHQRQAAAPSTQRSAPLATARRELSPLPPCPPARRQRLYASPTLQFSFSPLLAGDTRYVVRRKPHNATAASKTRLFSCDRETFLTSEPGLKIAPGRTD